MKNQILTSLLLPLLMLSLSNLQAQPQAQPLHTAQPQMQVGIPEHSRPENPA